MKLQPGAFSWALFSFFRYFLGFGLVCISGLREENVFYRSISVLLACDEATQPN
jgi:hypothetical protein